jgi:hypothetical protein
MQRHFNSRLQKYFFKEKEREKEKLERRREGERKRRRDVKREKGKNSLLS